MNQIEPALNWPQALTLTTTIIATLVFFAFVLFGERVEDETGDETFVNSLTEFTSENDLTLTRFEAREDPSDRGMWIVTATYQGKADATRQQ